MAKLTVEFAYPLICVPRRARAERVLWVKDRVEVDVRDVSTDEAPLGLRMIPGQVITSSTYGWTIERYALDGAPFDARTLASGNVLDTSAAADGLFSVPTSVGGGAGSFHAPWAGVRRDDMLDDRPTGLSLVVRDGHDEVRDKVIEAARRTALREGRLLRRSDLPCLTIHSYYSTSAFSCVWRSGLFHGGYEFRLDDDEGMRAVAAVAAESGYRKEGEDVPKVRYEGDLDLFAWDARPAAAREAALQLRHAAGRAAEKMSPEAFRRLGKVVQLCEAVETDASRASELTTELGAFAESLEGGARNVVLKDVRLAEAALELAGRRIHDPAAGEAVPVP